MANAGSGGPGGSGSKPTKAQRQETARRQREEIRRQMAARKRNRTIGIALVVAAAVALAAVLVLHKGSPSASASGQSVAAASMQQLLTQAPAAAKTAGCDAVQQTPNYQNAAGADPSIDHAHIGDATAPTPPAFSTYPTQPPVSGPHNSSPLGAGTYDTPPDFYQSLHSLEHGAVVIWYSPSAANSQQVGAIKALYGGSQDVGQAKVIVAPYDYPDQGTAGQLPKGVQMAVVAWHRLLTCAEPNLAVAFQFASQYESPPVAGQKYAGVAREPTSGI